MQVVATVFELLNLLPIPLPRKDSQSKVEHVNGYPSLKPKFVCMGIRQSKDKFHCVEPAQILEGSICSSVTSRVAPHQMFCCLEQMAEC